MVIPRSFIGGDLWDSDIFWWLLGISVSITCYSALNIPVAIHNSSYSINNTTIDSEHDISMHEVYDIDKALRK